MVRPDCFRFRGKKEAFPSSLHFHPCPVHVAAISIFAMLAMPNSPRTHTTTSGAAGDSFLPQRPLPDLPLAGANRVQPGGHPGDGDAARNDTLTGHTINWTQKNQACSESAAPRRFLDPGETILCDITTFVDAILGVLEA